jgi:hypothetical protein
VKAEVEVAGGWIRRAREELIPVALGQIGVRGCGAHRGRIGTGKAAGNIADVDDHQIGRAFATCPLCAAPV